MEEADASNRSSRSKTFKRGYVACVSCRTRKARCIIEDEPPCVKCRRDHRECVFAARDKRFKQREAPKWTKTRTSSVSEPTIASQAHAHAVDVTERSSTPTRVAASKDVSDSAISDMDSSNTDPLYGRVMSTVLTGSNDALNVLSGSVRAPDSASATSHAPDTVSSSGHHSTYAHGYHQESHIPAPNVVNEPDSGPAAVHSGNSSLGYMVSQLSNADEGVLDLWEKVRFVRQGWFTAQEAVTYVDLFFKYIVPLTPIILKPWCDHASHARLVEEEALLCCSILTISSRFFTLPGSGGFSRSQHIHQRLWNHCEFLIKRLAVGVEKRSTSRIRVIGTIEALILISDWQPRAIHFPPDTEGWDRLLINPTFDRNERLRTNDQEEPLLRWRDDVFEPAVRANRMSWMLLGLANSLAYEIGVFSADGDDDLDPDHESKMRRLRLRKILYTHVTQMSTQLGLPPVYPETIALEASRSFIDYTRGSEIGETQLWNSYVDLNLELVQLSHTAWSMFFRSAGHLQRQIQGNHYSDHLDHFLASLARWQADFNSKSKDITDPLRDSLLIEFHHLKTCVSAVSIQAVVARASASGRSTAEGSPNAGESLAAFITPRDARYLQEVLTASKRVLQLATVSSFQSHLPFAPSRLKISVISATVFLLKALSVGSNNTDVQDALSILYQCTARLKSTPVDDMDFALRYASLVEKHASQFKANLVSSRNTGVDTHMATGATPYNLAFGTPMAHPNHSPDFMGSMNLGMAGTDDSFFMGLPFDADIAPFQHSSDQLSMGLDADSLNFLWNLPDTLG